MKRTSLVVVGLVILAAAALQQAQQSSLVGNPFIHVSDTGQLVHVLPPPALLRTPWDTQPVFAPPSQGYKVYPASYGSGNLSYHGGGLISGAGYWAVYWNQTVANAKGSGITSGTYTIQSEIAAFVNSYPDGKNYDFSLSDDYEVIQQYGVSGYPVANSWGTGLVGSFVDVNGTQSSIKDSQIQQYLKNLFAAGKIPENPNILYGVYFPSGMKVILNGGGSSCSTFCGYHGYFSYGSDVIKYAVFPYPNCTGCKLASRTVADMLTIIGSHEIREAVTDPTLNSWYDQAGYEADDKCAWHNLYSTTAGFWVQPEYSNGNTVVPGTTSNYPGPGCAVANAQ